MSSSSPPPASPLPAPQPPEPLTAAQERARRAQQRAFIEQEQAAGRLPQPQPALPPATDLPPSVTQRPRTPGAPAAKRFHAHELRRVPVDVSARARALIDASSSQGRLLPQALAEVFGEHPDLAHVRVDAIEKAQYFDVSDAERAAHRAQHAQTGAAHTLEPHVVRIEVTHASGHDALAHHWFINAATLALLDAQTRLPRFNAEQTARELLRLYRVYEQHVRDAAAREAPGATEGSANA